MGLAHKSVVLYQSIKIGKKWKFRPVDEDSSHFSVGSFYVSWYQGKKKQMDPVGRDPEHALRMANLKRAALACASAGGEIRDTGRVQIPVRGSAERQTKDGYQAQSPAEKTTEIEVNKDNAVPTPNEHRRSVSTAISEYLADCLDRQGKSGYGLAPRTHETYRYRLGFLAEFRPKAFLDEIDQDFVKAFRRFLREHDNDLGDRTSYNIMQGVSTFLLRNGITEAKPILKEMSFPPTEVIPYSIDEMRTFFAACDEKGELLFKFFLHSMARDMEVANCEVRDFKFDINVLHICPKPARDFRLKGKRSGQETKGRKVPMPAIFMARMKVFCVGMGPRQLLFPNGLGEVEFHFLRKCKSIARRAGIVGWEDFDLHRWRKTGATKHHNDGVSTRHAAGLA